MASFYETSTPQDQARTSSAPPKQSALLIILIALLVPSVLAYLLVSGNETHVVALVLAALGGIVIIARPFWGLIFFIGLLYTRPEENIPALAGARLPLIISLVTMVALIFQKLMNREGLVKTPLNAMIIGFGVIAVASSFISATTSTAVQDIARLIILVLLILNLAGSREHYQILITSVLMFTGYLAAYSIHLYFTGGALVEHGTLRSQATGIFSDPNDLAATIVAGLSLALVRVRQSSKFLMRLLYTGIAGLMGTAILLTESRGGMLALFIVLGIFIFCSSRNKPLAIAIGVITVLALLTLKSGRMAQFDSGEESANSRFWFWSNGVEQLISHPLLGVGYGGFPELNGGMTAHNSFVLCFAETGLLGYFFWMGCLYYAFKQLKYREAPTDSSDSADHSWDILAPRLALIGYLAGSFWLSHTYTPILYVLLSLPVAQQLAFSQCYNKQNSQRDVFNRDQQQILMISLASILFIYIFATRMM